MKRSEEILTDVVFFGMGIACLILVISGALSLTVLAINGTYLHITETRVCPAK